MTIFVGWVTCYPPTMPDETIDLMVGNQVTHPTGAQMSYFEELK